MAEEKAHDGGATMKHSEAANNRAELAKKMAEDPEFRARVQARVNKRFTRSIFISLFLFVLALSAVCIYIGATCLDKCELEPLIPVYLLVFGAVTLASTPNYFTWLLSPQQSGTRYIFFGVYRLTTWGLELAVLIFGSVVIYGAPSDNLKDNKPKCICLLVGFAFVTATWVTLALSIVLSCIAICCYSCAVFKEVKAQNKPEGNQGTQDKKK